MVVNDGGCHQAAARRTGDLRATTLRRAFQPEGQLAQRWVERGCPRSMEQVLNVWLAGPKPMQPSLLQLSTDDAMQAFGQLGR